MSATEPWPQGTVDLTNCDREPIHIPGAIQPYGALLAVDERTGRVRMASESVERHLGVAAGSMIGRPFADCVGADTAGRLMDLALHQVDRSGDTVTIDGRAFDALVHRSDGLVVAELVPRAADEREARRGVAAEMAMSIAMRGALAAIESAESLAELADGIAREMRALTGFDRVWVYRFHEDWHGEIIGESRRADIETWLGMHYPASDIPAQARALFLKNWVRVIPDLDFTPSRLVPTINPESGVPLNLGRALTRSVSPIHVQYLKNMGVTASLVISLIHQGKLWGLISGHHYSGPRLVTAETLATCEFLAYALSMQVGAAERLADRQQALEIVRLQRDVIEKLSVAEDLDVSVADAAPTLMRMAGATGVALVSGDRVVTAGRTPTEAQIGGISRWVHDRREPIVGSSALSRELAEADAYCDVASGVLAATLSVDRRQQLLWFRGEQRQTVRWAGDPRKPVVLEPGGSARLHPRGSFELWEEEVRRTARPWEREVIAAAGELRRALLDVLIARAEKMAALNAELQLSVDQLEEAGVELEAQRDMLDESLRRESDARLEAERANRAKSEFLAMMSHELRTPLNAIGGYATIIGMGLRGPVTPEQSADLGRIESNQRHLLGLINNILNFAKIEAGAVQFDIAPVNVTAMLASLDPIVAPQMRAKSIRFETRDCGEHVDARGDEEKLRQILINLLTNALKFTPPGGSVTMTCEPRGDMVAIIVTWDPLESTCRHASLSIL